MKYKLIKEYPGSPKLGTIAEKQIKSQTYYHICNDRTFGVLPEYVEDVPEYWEEIYHIYYLVFTEQETSFNAWEPIKVEAIKYDTNTRKYFSTKEEAEEFIFYNKPCLSYNDVRKNIHVGFSTERILRGINKTLKERL